MRTASPLILAAGLCAATPAFATSSILCRSQPRGPEIWLGVGNGDDIGIFQARIVDGRREIVTGHGRGAPRIVSQIVNPRRLALRIVAAGRRGPFATLQAVSRGTPYLGTFSYRGRTWRIRCLWDEDQ